MPYRLITTAVIATATATALYETRELTSINEELRNDPQIPVNSRISIVEHLRQNRVVAVSETAGDFELFYASRDPWMDRVDQRWVVEFYINANAATGQNTKGPEISELYKHFPTDAEIASFLARHGIVRKP